MAPHGDSNPVPKKDPNFLLVVILAAVAILVILLLSFFTIDWEGKRIVPKAKGDNKHPTSQIVLSGDASDQA